MDTRMRSPWVHCIGGGNGSFFCTLMLRFLRKIGAGRGARVLGLGCIASQGYHKACMCVFAALEGYSVAWIAQRLDNERHGFMNRHPWLMLQSHSPIFY